MPTFYRPDDGVAADFIPFYWNGDFHLFYLKDYRDAPGHGEGTPWFHVATKDFVTFEDWGEALPRGEKDDQDLWVFTGSVIEREGTFHIFYTGHNSHFCNTDKPVQMVMHATSPDLLTWKKDASFVFAAPQDEYEKDDWRDPFVFWNAEAKEYWMLLAARRKSVVPSRNRGCTALAASPDLAQWEVRPPFWAPDEYFTHECPDLFHFGGWWYVAYSTFTDRCVTHYRAGRSLAGPWLCPSNDTFDGRAFYAAKTATDGNKRFVFGWLPTRQGDKDDGGWQWGGNLVVHEVLPQRDGTLAVHPPKTVVAPFNRLVPLSPKPALGQWSVDRYGMTTNASGRFAALECGTLPDECYLRTTVTFKRWTQSCGLFLRADGDFNSYYQVRLEPNSARIVIDRWPRPGDQPFMVERSMNIRGGYPVELQVLVDGTCLVVYANDQVALSCRMYDHPTGRFGVFVNEGEASFQKTMLRIKE